MKKQIIAVLAGAMGASAAFAQSTTNDETQPKVFTVQAQCGDHQLVNLIFDHGKDTLTLEFTGHDRFELKPAESGSGFRFVGHGYEYHGKGKEGIMTYPDGKTQNCKELD